MRNVLVVLLLAGVLLFGCAAQAPRLGGTYSGTFKGIPDTDDPARNGIVSFDIEDSQVTGSFTTHSGRTIGFTGVLNGTRLRITADPDSRCNVTATFSEAAGIGGAKIPSFSGRLACPDLTASWNASVVFTVRFPEEKPEEEVTEREQAPPTTVAERPEEYRYQGMYTVSATYINYREDPALGHCWVGDWPGSPGCCIYELKVSSTIPFNLVLRQSSWNPDYYKTGDPEKFEIEGDPVEISWKGTLTVTGTGECPPSGSFEGTVDSTMSASLVTAEDYHWKDIPLTVSSLSPLPHLIKGDVAFRGISSGDLLAIVLGQFRTDVGLQQGDEYGEPKFPISGGELTSSGTSFTYVTPGYSEGSYTVTLTVTPAS